MPAAIPVDNTLGALLIGVALSCIIYGVTVLQVYSYYLDSRKDKLYLKLFVAFVMLLDSLSVAMVLHALYFYTITSFGDYQDIQYHTWSIIGCVPVGVVVAVCVQGFFAYRIWRLSGRTNKWVPAFIAVLGVGELACDIEYMVITGRHLLLADTAPSTPWATATLICELVCDVAITASMVYYLRKGKGAYKRTNVILDKLVLYTLNTGLLTSIFTTLTVVALIAQNNQKTLIYAVFYFILVRVYSCSFLSILNSRKTLKERVENVVVDNVLLSNIQYVRPNDIGSRNDGSTQKAAFATA